MKSSLYVGYLHTPRLTSHQFAHPASETQGNFPIRKPILRSNGDFILSKLDWAKESRSQMQLDDVRNLLRLVQELEAEYLNQWADRLGLTTLYQEVRQWRIRSQKWTPTIGPCSRAAMKTGLSIQVV